LEAITRRVEADPALRGETLSGPFWNVCHGGQLAAAQYLLAHGANLDWLAPWSGQTPRDVAEKAGQSDVTAWLRRLARSAASAGEPSRLARRPDRTFRAQAAKSPFGPARQAVQAELRPPTTR
jgi:hypothetical protein